MAIDLFVPDSGSNAPVGQSGEFEILGVIANLLASVSPVDVYQFSAWPSGPGVNFLGLGCSACTHIWK